MRTLLTLTAVLLTLSSGTTNAQTNTQVPGKGADAGEVHLLHIPVRSNGVVGTLVVPDSTHVYPGVLRIGGGEGGISVGDAETIASQGYAVLAIAYFGIEGLPGDLQEVPVEYFGKTIDWMKQSSYIDHSTKLAIIGISR